ncbi:MAG: M56 family metallopeptidase [Anaeromyxobacter sp.]
MTAAVAHWLASGVLHGTALLAVAWALGATALRGAHPSARAVLFGLALAKFLVPFGPSFELSPAAGAPLVEGAPAVGAVVAFATAPAGAVRETAWLEVAVWAWGLVALALALRRGSRHRAALRTLGPVVAPPARVEALAARMGVAAPRLVFQVSSPRLVGVWRPVLVLPVGVEGPALDAIVAHELAHLRRRDPLWLALQAVVETVFWFWPAVRLASRELTLAREQACDLAVLEAGVIEPAGYAGLLLELGLERSGSLAMAARPTQLERRITMILDGTKARPRRVLLVSLVAMAGLLAARTSATPEPAPIQITGALEARAVNTQVYTQRPDLEPCYRSYLAAHPGTRGAVLLHFTVNPDGSVGEACQSKGTTLPDEIGRCVSERVMKWWFPATQDGRAAEVEVRFDFAP